MASFRSYELRRTLAKSVSSLPSNGSDNDLHDRRAYTISEDPNPVPARAVFEPERFTEPHGASQLRNLEHAECRAAPVPLD